MHAKKCCCLMNVAEHVPPSTLDRNLSAPRCAHKFSRQGKLSIIIISHTLTMATTNASNGACKVVLAGTIAKRLLVEVSEGLDALNNRPRIHGYLANQDPAARMYADWTAKTCKEKYALA